MPTHSPAGLSRESSRFVLLVWRDAGNPANSRLMIDHRRLARGRLPSVRYVRRFLSDIGARCPRDPPGTQQPTRSTEPLRPRSSLLGTELSHLKLRRNSDQTQVHSRRTTRMAIAPPSPGKSPLETPRPWRSIRFGKGFENCWYKVPGVPSLELSGDLSFRGPQRLCKLRIDCNGRPYVLASKVAGQGSKGRARQGKAL